MPKKPRPNPYEQGSVTSLYKVLIAPFLDLKPPQQEVGEWMEQLFDFSHRDIIRFTAKKHFKLPGLLLVAPLVPVQGVGVRYVPKDAALWVRLNSREPNKVHVEFISGELEQVFQLTAMEWEWTKLHLVEAEKERKR